MPDSTPNAPVSAPSANFHELSRKFDEEIEKLSSKKMDNFFFGFDGLNFGVRRIAHEGKNYFLFRTTIGYLPFSIESDERRDAIQTILSASKTLPRVRFDVDTASRISVSALFDTPPNVSPDFIFYPLAVFMQESRPFIELIGKYLLAPSLSPSPAPKEKPKEAPAAKDD